MGMNEYTIKLIDGKQSFYRPINALNSVEIKTLKTYIETYVKTSFIQLSKFSARAYINFDKKSDGSQRLCVNY